MVVAVDMRTTAGAWRFERDELSVVRGLRAASYNKRVLINTAAVLFSFFFVQKFVEIHAWVGGLDTLRKTECKTTCLTVFCPYLHTSIPVDR